MLPEHHHPHDKQWLIKQFDAIPVGKRGAVSHKYSVAYRDAHAAEPVEHLRDNVARRTSQYSSACLYRTITKNNFT